VAGLVIIEMQFLYVFSALLGVVAQKALADSLACSETESCKEIVAGNNLLQRTMKNNDGLDVEKYQVPTDAYSFTDENGYPLTQYEKEGYSVFVNVSWDDATADVYHHVENTDMCNAICIKNTTGCKGFIFYHEPEADGLYKCYLATSQGTGTSYHPCCHVGIPYEHTTTTSTTTGPEGMFKLSHIRRSSGFNPVFTDWCATETDGEYVVEECEPMATMKSEMMWVKEPLGYYVNSVSGKCMSFGNPIPSGMDGLLVPSDPSELANAAEECVHLDETGKLRIGRDFLDPYKKSCYQEKMPDGLLWWFSCKIGVVKGQDSKMYLTANAAGTGSASSWTETEVPSNPTMALLQSTVGSGTTWDCRDMATKTCPTFGMVNDIPEANRHKCWDGGHLPWWGECRCQLSGCNNKVPCLVKIIEIVDAECILHDAIANTSDDASVGKEAA